MKKSSTFGNFLYYKRKESGQTLKEVAKSLEIAFVYLSELESGKKTNPSNEILQGFIKVYNLNAEETATFYDLHAKANGIVSKDISDYIMKKGVVRKAIRTSQSKNSPDKDWTNFEDKLSKK